VCEASKNGSDLAHAPTSKGTSQSTRDGARARSRCLLFRLSLKIGKNGLSDAWSQRKQTRDGVKEAVSEPELKREIKQTTATRP